MLVATSTYPITDSVTACWDGFLECHMSGCITCIKIRDLGLEPLYSRKGTYLPCMWLNQFWFLAYFEERSPSIALRALLAVCRSQKANQKYSEISVGCNDFEPPDPHLWEVEILVQKGGSLLPDNPERDQLSYGGWRLLCSLCPRTSGEKRSCSPEGNKARIPEVGGLMRYVCRHSHSGQRLCSLKSEDLRAGEHLSCMWWTRFDPSIPGIPYIFLSTTKSDP